VAVRGLRAGKSVPTPQSAGPAKGVVSLEAGKRPHRGEKDQQQPVFFRQKTYSESKNQLRSRCRCKITHLRRGSLACWLLTLAIFAITACGGGSGNSGGGTSTPTPTPTPTPSTANEWTWESGSNAHAAGIYGTQGTSSTGNAPGSRYEAVNWTDSSGNLWLFGGYGIDSTAQSAILTISGSSTQAASNGLG